MPLACRICEQKPLLDFNTCRVSLSLLDIEQGKIFKMCLQGTFVIIFAFPHLFCAEYAVDRNIKLNIKNKVYEGLFS